jgi:hypothetical protein
LQAPPFLIGALPCHMPLGGHGERAHAAGALGLLGESLGWPARSLLL